jgi:3-oxoacyl-[acyl-carrier protein] reductase
LTGKVAIVTGASKGIGAGIAKGLAAAGASVVVNDSTSKEGADRVVSGIAGKGGRAVAVQGDLSKAADVKRLFEETKKAFVRNTPMGRVGLPQDFAPLAVFPAPDESAWITGGRIRVAGGLQ